MMEADSQRCRGRPSTAAKDASVSAGMRPFGLISRNHGSCASPFQRVEPWQRVDVGGGWIFLPSLFLFPFTSFRARSPSLPRVPGGNRRAKAGGGRGPTDCYVGGHATYLLLILLEVDGMDLVRQAQLLQDN